MIMFGLVRNKIGKGKHEDDRGLDHLILVERDAAKY